MRQICSVISVHLGAEFRSHVVAHLKSPVGRRTHSVNFGASRPDKHEIVLCPVGFEKTLDLSDKLVFRHSHFNGVDEMFISQVCQSGSLFDVCNLLRSFEASQLFDESRRGDRFLARMPVKYVDKPRFHQFHACHCDL